MSGIARRHRRMVLPPALAAALLAAWAPGASVAPEEPLAIETPATPGSRLPDIATLPDGRLVMSWLQSSPAGGRALRSAIFDGSRWTNPVTIAAGDSLLANSADFPSLCPLGGTRLAAQWLLKRGAHASDVCIAQSPDLGRTWTAPVTPHRDGTATEHGFVSLVPAPDGVLAVWLDGRNTVGHEEGEADMTLRSARVTATGALLDEVVLDGRVCDCCPTAAVEIGGEILVAYRDRDAGEIRDIGLVRRANGRWSEPRRLSADGWRIAGCPVNGPALSARGAQVVAAWYTVARDTARAFVAFSGDRGVTFGRPIRVDQGSPAGHLDLAWTGDEAAVVTWLESSESDTRLCARRVARSGRADPVRTIARLQGASARAFPRIAVSRDRLYVAWTEAGDPARVRLAAIVR